MEILSGVDADRIINETFDFLENTGVRFDKDEKVFRLLSQAGCEITEDDKVKFPTALVRETLKYVPKSFQWWNRAGTEFIEYGGGRSIFISDSKAPNYIDPSTGERKPADCDSAALMVKLVDALAEIDVCGTPLSTDNFIADNAATILNTSKPAFLTAGDKAEILEAAIEMAAAVRGSREKLREKPYFGTIISPEVLHYPQEVIRQIQLCTENNVPVFLGAFPLGGVSSPVTIAGTLVVSLACTLPGIVLAQVLKKGHPCNDHSFPTFMDPATAGIGGVPENAMADLARSQICRKLGLPLSQQTALAATGREFNQETMVKTAWDFGELSRSPFDAFWGAGTIDCGLAFSPHSLIYANELASLARRVWRGIPVNDETLAIDKIKNVDSGMFIVEEHTAIHAREDLWHGKYSLPPAGSDGSVDLKERIDEHLKNILATHTPEPPPETLRQAIQKIVDKYGS
jgi:trimethylamine--corrinoid protein Co-methyltransferase